MSQNDQDKCDPGETDLRGHNDTKDPKDGEKRSWLLTTIFFALLAWFLYAYLKEHGLSGLLNL